jgi:drug/metabolite transporter (DMT)-like permease
MKQQLSMIIPLIVLTSACDTVNQLFLKSAVNRLKVASPLSVGKLLRFVFSLLRIPRVWMSFIFSTLSLCIWLVVLSRADLNFAFSVDSMHYIFIALTSRYILKERVGLKRWLGTILIVCGIIIVSLN